MDFILSPIKYRNGEAEIMLEWKRKVLSLYGKNNALKTRILELAKADLEKLRKEEP